MRTTKIKVDLGAMRHNIAALRKRAPNSGIMAIIKANGYGHGMLETANVCVSEGVEMLGVAYATEGAELRRAGITLPITCIVPVPAWEADALFDNDLQTTIASLACAKNLNELAEKRRIKLKAHLFVNTGMNRDGIKPEQALGFMKEAQKLDNLDIVGLCTHFATSDSSDETFALEQARKFDDCLKELNAAGYEFKYVHAANSSAVLKFPQTHYNLLRPGIAIYGYMSERDQAESMGLKPAMEILTKVIKIQYVKKGETVGYGLRYIAEKDSKIAVIPLGYGDGFTRAFTNSGVCLIKGKKYRLAGTVCMDQCMVEIGQDDIHQGDDVILMGRDAEGNEISVYDLAGIANTIPYEITTLLSKRIPRVYEHGR